jgi:transglutaminase-like putative cysteine protease
MWLRVRCTLLLDLEVPTTLILMLRPRSGAQQWIAREEYLISPMVNVTESSDSYGNLCQQLVAPVGKFSVQTSAEVMIPDVVEEQPGAPFVEVKHLPEDVLRYLLPSRYCESDRFNEMASIITANVAPGYDQVVAIENWLREYIQYIPGSSVYPLSAVEVNLNQSGVCRDLAHLGIALCRSICIPARMVVGYLHGLEPMDMHAWFEAFVGDRWYTFDATQTGQKKGYVVIGVGKDASDVAVYNQFGPLIYSVQQTVQVEKIEVTM